MLTIASYNTRSELQRAHPEIRSFKLVFHAPRGQSAEKQLQELRQHCIQGMVYRVGDFFWQEAENISLKKPQPVEAKVQG